MTQITRKVFYTKSYEHELTILIEENKGIFTLFYGDSHQKLYVHGHYKKRETAENHANELIKNWKKTHGVSAQELGLDDIEDMLFHVTSMDYLDSIMKKGLEPSLSDLTKDAWMRLKSNELEQEGKEVDIDDLYKKAENLPELVFAAEYDDLPAAIQMINKNVIAPVPFSQICVIGIKTQCKNQFKKKEIASAIDYISEKTILPRCLVIIKRETWLPIYKKSKS